MKTYRVTITGTSPLLMHMDNIDWADKMEQWKSDPSSKKESKAGDDRSYWASLLPGAVASPPPPQAVRNASAARAVRRCMEEGRRLIGVSSGGGWLMEESGFRSAYVCRCERVAWGLRGGIGRVGRARLAAPCRRQSAP